MTLAVGDWIVMKESNCYGVTTPGAVGKIVLLVDGGSEVAVQYIDCTLYDGNPSDVRYDLTSPSLYTVRVANVEKIDEAEVPKYVRRKTLSARCRDFISRMKQNLRPAPRNVRNHALRVEHKQFGEQMREAISYASENGYAHSDAVNLLNGLSRTQKSKYGHSLREKLDPDNSIVQCNDCGSYEWMDDAEFVGDDYVCSSCIESSYRWSSCMEEYILEDNAFPLYLSMRAYRNEAADDWCTRAYGDSYHYSYVDCFVDSDVYYELTEDGIDESREDDDGLMGYHSSDRNFIERNATPSVPALGVELEVYADDRHSSVHAAKDATNNWYFERDSSLDDYHGFEIISQPYGPTEWPEQAKNVLDALMESSACAYSHPDKHNNYGIHVNVHRKHFTGLQEARMLMFLLDTGNAEFVRAIAQRQAIYGSGQNFGTIEKPTVRAIGGIDYNKKPYSLGKYSPLNLHGNLAEFRLFQSTLHYPSFMKNLEFVWALIEWTSVKSATGNSFSHIDFIRWLAAKPTSEQQYPHLLAFLRKPSFMGKRYTERIRNTWSHLLPKQTTKSLDVVSGEPDLRLAA